MSMDMEKIHDAAEPMYVPLARLTLWFVSFVLLWIVCGAVVYRIVVGQPSVAVVQVAVQACQVLSVITLAILGYRGHRGMKKP